MKILRAYQKQNPVGELKILNELRILRKRSSLMTKKQLNYFEKMKPGQTLSIDQVKKPEDFIQAGKDYIDAFGTMEFNFDYTVITKLRPIPQTNELSFFISI